MTTEQLSLIRQSYQNDLSRPIYHYLPARNWMNDPNGVIHWNGKHHLFYQYNPDGAYHANMHWGHAVSDDLIHWRELPIAIAPTPNSIDEGGIFSGCMVNDNGTPTAIYTGVNHGASIQTQCIATGNADLTLWQKAADNPVLSTPPPHANQTVDFRDPFVWREDDGWYMVVGSRIEGLGGAAFLYRSHDLHDWVYLNPLFVGDLARHGVVWECPNFFKLGDKWVLIISAHIGYATGTVLYFVGDYHEHRFYPQREGVLDAAYYYAPLTYEAADGRRLMQGWIREGRSDEAQMAAGWSGVQGIPRILRLDAQHRLQMTPVPELHAIRSATHHFTTADDIPEVLPVRNLALDIEMTLHPTASPCGIALACAADGSEGVEITYETVTQTLRVHRWTELAAADTTLQGIQHRLDVDEDLNLRILLDGSVLEIIANQRTSLTSRIYPTHADNKLMRVIQPAALGSLTIHEMSSIW